MYKRRIRGMNVAQCIDLESTAEGAKPLTNPLQSTSQQSVIKNSKMKPVVQQYARCRSFSTELTNESPLLSEPSDDVVEPQCVTDDIYGTGNQNSCIGSSAGFVTAREYMNPAVKFAEQEIIPATCDTSALGTGERNKLINSSVVKRETKRSNRLPSQSNSLDRYFRSDGNACQTVSSATAVASTDLNSFAEASCSATDMGFKASKSAEITPTCSPAETVTSFPVHKLSQSDDMLCCGMEPKVGSITPTNSPAKTVMMSPIHKVPGSDNMYYCGQLPHSHFSEARSPHDIQSLTPTCSPAKTVMMSPIHKVAGSDTIYYGGKSPSGHLDDAQSLQGDKKDENLLQADSLSVGQVAKNLQKSFVSAFQQNPRKLEMIVTKSVASGGGQKRRARKQLIKPRGGKRQNIASKVSTTTSANMFGSFFTNSSNSTSSTSDLNDNVTDDLYGMFGFSDHTLLAVNSDSDFETDSPCHDYMSQLPSEVLTNIMCRLPFTDWCLNINRVCLTWRDVMNSVQFMPWKKTYFRLLKGLDAEKQKMLKCMTENGMTARELYLPLLVRSMKTFKPKTGMLMAKCNPLQKHRLFDCAVAVMKERLPGCMIDNEVPNPWCLIAMVAILADNVSAVSGVLRCLLGCRAKCTAEELIDCLYCVASYLLMFKQLYPTDIWTRLHYQVYYALYLYENDSTSTFRGLSNALTKQNGQQSIRRYSTQDTIVRLTHEQLRICNHNMDKGELIKIVAFAGTGKTTTLMEYARLRPNKKFLLVVYNKSVQEHSRSRFPRNVDCFTSHALAFKYVGRRYAAAGKLGNVKVNDVLQQIPWRKGHSVFVEAKFIVDTLNRFMASDHENITTAHVPSEMMHETKGMISIDHAKQMSIANDAEVIWSKMKDLRNPKLKMTHDGYLKLWQLSRPLLADYDVIMIDEAQDLTPAVADIFKRQKQARIMVGDPHQQIYGFRGAVNAMEMVTATRIFYLTQSFRFGPEIAAVAATCLEFLKGEKRKILVGSGIPGGVMGEEDGQIAIITRTNYQLFKEAVNKCCFSDKDIKVAFAGLDIRYDVSPEDMRRASDGIMMHNVVCGYWLAMHLATRDRNSTWQLRPFSISLTDAREIQSGIESFGFDMILDIYCLMTNLSEEEKRGRIRNPLVKAFINRGFVEFKNLAVNTMDAELLGKIRIVETYTVQLESHIDKIRSKCVHDSAMADVILSTAHKAKGLEFDTVHLTDDYNPDGLSANDIPGSQRRIRPQPPVDECNLLYVAITRAKKRLQMCPTLVTILKRAGYDFCRLSTTKKLQQDGIAFICTLSKTPFETTNAVVLHQQKVTMANGCQFGDVVYSPQSVTENIDSLRHLAGIVDVGVIASLQSMSN